MSKRMFSFRSDSASTDSLTAVAYSVDVEGGK